NTPLIVGVGEDGMFLGSDVAAFIAHTKNAVELGQDSAVAITADNYEIMDFDGAPAEGSPFTIDWDQEAAEKDGFDSLMMKEIHAQPAAVRDTLAGRFVDGKVVLDEQRLSDDDLRNIQKVYVVACGSAYHSGLLAKYAIEHWARIPVEIEVASEFRYRDPVLNQQTLVVAVSQAGRFVDGKGVRDEQRLSDDDLRNIQQVYVVACGAAYHSGLLAKYAIEHWARIPVEIEVASEFRYRDPVLNQQTLVVAASQSGETADTLEAVRHAKTQGARVPAVCNTNG